MSKNSKVPLTKTGTLTVRVNEALRVNVLNDSTMCSGPVVFAGEQSSPTPCTWKSCRAVFPTKEDMERHRLQHLVGEAEEGSENLVCLMCGKSIPRNKINRHLLEHLAQREGRSIQCLIILDSGGNAVLVAQVVYEPFTNQCKYLFLMFPHGIIFALQIRDLKYILVNIYAPRGGS